MENKRTHNAKDVQADIERDLRADSRWGEDRRTEYSRGYTYVSMVGWIDRREKKRRKDDSTVL